MRQSEYFELIDLKLHSPDNIRLVNAFVESVKGHIPLPADHMFEVGCGYGLAAEQLMKYSKEVTVSDINEQSLNFIRWKFSPNTFGIRNDNNIPADVDFIYFFMSLHHIHDYRDLIENCIQHIIEVNGRGLAICELEPNSEHPFHLHEPSPFDGLAPEDFDFVNSIHDLTIKYENMPSLNKNGIDYHCYSLIIKTL